MASRKRLSPHFRVEEFDCHDGTRVAESRYPDLEHLCEWWLEPIRSEFGPVHVVSGFRTVAHNRAIGGAVHSVHLLQTPLPRGERRPRPLDPLSPGPWAAAADVIPAKGNPAKWAEWARALRPRHAHLGRQGRGGVGLYVASGFVHLDTGPARDWHG